ncbi:MAG TPA: glycosyl hydrolase family 8 [Candidatus Microsaccharimonas sp.]|nr:glycosyl hydrolase family 8 [Candidatus Microsaccharimonas sp.]
MAYADSRLTQLDVWEARLILRYKRYLPLTLFVLLIVIVGFVVPRHSESRVNHPAKHIDYPKVLGRLWTDYKQTSIDTSSGRTIDHQNDDKTTSEGQAYTMLRAVWMNDPTVFDQTWQWTQNNLRRNDGLYSWQWGKRADGSWGILTNDGGENTASDADTDIALALMMAANRWDNPSYLAAAKGIVQGIWTNEVVMIQGKPYLTADNLEHQVRSGLIVVNPSYFAPYAYRAFARIDPSHDWIGLVNNSYAALEASSSNTLDTKTSIDLPPDWVGVKITDGTFASVSGKDTDFSFDAFRAIWRTALDYEWSHDPQSLATLKRFGFLQQAWSRDGKLVAQYGHDGTRKVSYSALSLYGGTLSYFQFIQPKTAPQIMQQALLANYDPGTDKFAGTLNYYDNNWLWFGLALYAQALPNLTEGNPS